MATEALLAKRAYILAGGLGSRLKSIVSNVPKPLAKVAGTPFLEHLLRYLSGSGVQEVVLCVGHKGTMIKRFFGSRYRDCRLFYSEEDQPMGTGGALSLALERFPPAGPFLVLNGDTYFPIRISRFCELVPRTNWIWKLALFESSNSSRYGRVVVGPDSRVLSVEHSSDRDARDESPEFLANSGIWLCRSTNLRIPLSNNAGAYSLERYISDLAASDSESVVAAAFSDTFIDIGLPDDYLRAQKMNLFLKQGEGK